jgi:hypothetical protein
MGREQRDRTHVRSQPLIFLAVAAAALFVPVYVLLLGPAVWLHDHGYGGRILPIIYAPLEWAAAKWEPVESALRFYIEIFR